MNEDLYFKDAFTKDGDDINIEVNNLTTNCITNKNNNFSLDSDGNLIVNSITTKNNNNTEAIDFNSIYPIGSIYMSVNNINPSTLFGGVWEQINNRFLLASGDYSSGLAGGATSATTSNNGAKSTGGTALNINQIPSHTHGVGTYNIKGQFEIRHGRGGNVNTVYAQTNGCVIASNNTGTQSWANGLYVESGSKKLDVVKIDAKNNQGFTGASGAAGGSQAHTHSISDHNHTVSIMPPYLVVNMWKRIS